MEILGITLTTKDIMLLVVGATLGAILGALAAWLASRRVRAENRGLGERLGHLEAGLAAAHADAAQSHQELTRLGAHLGLFTPVEQPGVAEVHYAVQRFLTGTSRSAVAASADRTVRHQPPPAPLPLPAGHEERRDPAPA